MPLSAIFQLYHMNYSSHDIVALETNPFYMYLKYFRNHSGRDCMVVGFTTTCVISDYHHESFESKPRSIQHYVIKLIKKSNNAACRI
jgi:hypothetical protein